MASILVPQARYLPLPQQNPAGDVGGRLRTVHFDVAEACKVREGFDLSQEEAEGVEDVASSNVVSENGEAKQSCAMAIVTQRYFSLAVACLIICSTVSMAIETDHPDLTNWILVNNVLLVFFVIELTLRLVAYGREFFCNQDWSWNVFDLCIVVSGVIDQVVLDLILGQTDALAHSVMLLRIVRILRILRVLRLFHHCEELLKLAKGLVESLQIVVWIALLMFGFMLVVAILLTNVAGNRAWMFENPNDIELYWHGVIRSVYTLFQMLTLDNWSEISRQVTDELPWMRVVFNCYIFFSAFAMLSLLTGVIADHMSEVSQQSEDEEAKTAAEDLKKFCDCMRLEFTSAGGNAEHAISKKDFEKILEDEELREQLEQNGADLSGHDAEEFWDCLDKDGDGLLSWDEFKSGLIRLREVQPEAKDVLKMRYAAERVARRLERGQGDAHTLRKLDEVNEMMTAVERSLGSLEKQLRGFMDFALNTGLI